MTQNPQPVFSTADPIYSATAAGQQELRGRVTDLDGVALELLVRLDGTQAISTLKGAMAAAGAAAFESALATLVRRGLAAPKAADPMAISFDEQLLRLTPQLSRPGTVRSSADGFAVSLVRRRRQPPPARAGGLIAVVVEDDPVLSKFIECFLALDGFEVRLAADRAGIVAQMNRPERPDIVLLDGTLPDVDGFHVLRKLRAHPRLCNVPIVMLTGRSSREAVIDALSGGADGYVTKPFDAEDLTKAVRAACGLDAAVAQQPAAGNSRGEQRNDNWAMSTMGLRLAA
ncbi:response regulator transcription factor [Ramlibacter humi]|nr:response regulator [Ramlibacter humi]